MAEPTTGKKPTPSKPLPQPYQDTAPYWEAARDHRSSQSVGGGAAEWRAVA